MESDNNRSNIADETLIQLEYSGVLEELAGYTMSAPGKELIMKAYPTDDIAYLCTEHDLIEEMINLLIKEDEMPLENLRDIRNTVFKTKIENNVLQPEEVLKIYDTLRMFRMMRKYLLDRAEEYPLLSEKGELLFENRLLEKHINEAIDDTGLIRDNATAELQKIRTSIHEKSAALRSRLRKILRKVTEEDIATEEFFTIREGRFVLPIRPSHKRKMPGIIHGISQTGGTVFMEPSEIVEMNNDLSMLHSEEKKEMYRIMKNLTGEVGRDAAAILGSIDIAAHIDAVKAKANYALEYGGIKPVISTENEIFIKDVRHPLLVHSKGKKNVIPLSIDFDDKKRGHLISGPNAGGKTVALKSIGVNLIMALSGIFPLGEVRTNYRTIFSSIGDRQSIENDLSTFSSQITQLKEIVESCDNRSLVLVDEIGSGTDPQEGAALACGILDTLININLFFVATTHQSSLKTYALNRDEISNASLEFDEENFIPTYKFIQGLPGNSYAFFLAKNVGLPEHIIERSRNYLGSRQQELEESINQLSKYRSEAMKLKHQLQEEKIKAEKVHAKYSEKMERVNERREKLLDEARQEAAGIVAEANSMIEKAIKEVREEKKPVSEIKSEYQNKKNEVVKKIEKSEKKKQKDKPQEAQHFEVGNKVSMDGSDTPGEILSLGDDGKTALVEFGGLKFNVKVSKLTNISMKEVRKIKRDIENTSKPVDNFKAESKLDLRGQRAEPALRQLDEFISDAVVGNVTPLSVIHGKGTGALRAAVHEVLKTHPSVKSFRLGKIVEGGDGITIIEL